MGYCYFCSEKNNYQFVTIQTILDDALKPINGYIKLLKNGKVSDSKVKVVNKYNVMRIGYYVVREDHGDVVHSMESTFKTSSCPGWPSHARIREIN